MVDGLMDDPDHEANRETITEWLALWRDNHARLQPALQASFLLQPLEPLSRNLADVAALGLEALEALQTGATFTEAQQQRQLTLLDRAAEPQDELLLQVVPAIRKLAEAAHGQVRDCAMWRRCRLARCLIWVKKAPKWGYEMFCCRIGGSVV